MKSREELNAKAVELLRSSYVSGQLYNGPGYILLEVLLDLRDQNERIIALLGQAHTHDQFGSVVKGAKESE